MKTTLAVLVLTAFAAVAWAGNPFPYNTPDPTAKTWHWRNANDGWWKYTAYWPGREVHTSWLDHGLGSGYLYTYFKHNRRMSGKKAAMYAFALGVAWEVKDAYFPYERWGKAGGDGFSRKDLVRDASGIAFAALWNRLTEKKKGR